MMKTMIVVLGAVIGVLGVGAATAAPMDRRLEINVALEGKQDWRNELQWSKATTAQRYEFSTTLRSDGVLEGANLLDMDLDARLAIKTEYLRRKGAAKLKASGIDPTSERVQAEISSRMQKDMFACKGEATCMSDTNSKYTELMAAAVQPDNSELFAGEPRYLFFFGYPGCANKIHAVHKYQATGETGYGRNKDKIFPYALSRDGDYAGSARDQTSMCSLFTVVLDTKEQKMFVENIYIPTSRGKVVRTEFGKTVSSEADLPYPDPLQGWINGLLRHGALSGTSSTTLPLNLPLDGNSTVLGLFTGEAKTTLKWSFTELAATKK